MEAIDQMTEVYKMEVVRQLSAIKLPTKFTSQLGHDGA